MSNSVEVIYTAKLGFATLSTANPNLDGSGALGTIITGAGDGTLVKSLIVKAQTNTTQGMVRLYVKKGTGGDTLFFEIPIPPIVKSSRDLSYYSVIPLNYTLQSGEILKASTQNAETFNLIAEAFDISYGTTANYLGSSLEYTSNSGAELISTANSNLDGSGSITPILIAGPASSGFSGCAITSVIIKARQTTTPGMVRLFIKDPLLSTPVLFCEVVIPSVIQSAINPSFMFQVIEQGSLCIPADFRILASTQNTENFSIVIESADWQYV